MAKTERSLASLCNHYICSDDSARVREELSALHQAGQFYSDVFLRPDSLRTVAQLKHLARRHGLPSQLAPALLTALKPMPERGQTAIFLRQKVQIATAIKYAMKTDHKFAELNPLVDCIKAVAKSSPVFYKMSTKGERQQQSVMDTAVAYFEQEILKQLCCAFGSAIPFRPHVLPSWPNPISLTMCKKSASGSEIVGQEWQLSHRPRTIIIL